MKHIAMIVPTFPVASETFVRTEIKSLIAAGHQVTVFTFHKQVEQWENVEIIDCSEVSFKRVLSSFAKTSASQLKQAFKVANAQKVISTRSLMIYGANLSYWIRKMGIEHVHCHFMQNSVAYGLVAGRLAGVRVSSIGHGHDVYVASADLQAKLQHCDFTVAVCKDMVAYFEELECPNIKLLHCGVDNDLFKVYEPPLNERKKLFFIGRLVEQKGLNYALDALGDIPKAQRPSLDVIGDGPLKAQLVEQVKTLGLTDDVTFLGQKTSPEIIELASQYDGFIAPFCIADTGDKDTGPVVLKEAMSMGIPVITCDVMGCREIVTPDVGYLVPSKDAEALKVAICNLCSLDDDQITTMRNSARTRTHTLFNAKKQALQLSSWIEGGQYEFN